MEKMWLSVDKAHDAEMRHVKTLDFCCDADDITVFELGNKLFFMYVFLVFIYFLFFIIRCNFVSISLCSWVTSYVYIRQIVYIYAGAKGTPEEKFSKNRAQGLRPKRFINEKRIDTGLSRYQSFSF